MEYVTGGDLYQMIRKKKKLTERNAAILLKGVVEALEEIHR
jgi:serine/threonine protein kinase